MPGGGGRGAQMCEVLLILLEDRPKAEKISIFCGKIEIYLQKFAKYAYELAHRAAQHKAIKFNFTSFPGPAVGKYINDIAWFIIFLQFLFMKYQCRPSLESSKPKVGIDKFFNAWEKEGNGGDSSIDEKVKLREGALQIFLLI